MSNEHRASSSPSSRSSWSWSFLRAPCSLLLAIIIWTAVGLWIWPQTDPLPATPPSFVYPLGSGIRKDSVLTAVGAERLMAAISYMRSSGAPRLVTSRSRRSSSGPLSDYGQRLIITPSGLADRWTLLDGIATTTRDEVLLLRRIAAPGTRIAVVTSGMHTRRACAAFRRVGFAVTCLSSGSDGPWWSTPYQVAYEMLGVIKYKWKGWM